MPTAVISVREMLADRLKTDTQLIVLLSGPKLFVGRVPPNTSLPYIELGQTTETPLGAGYFHRQGHAGTETIHCWARTKWTAQQMFARLSDLLDAQRITLAGHVMVTGVLEYVTDQAGELSPTGEPKSWQVIARYRIRSLVAA